MMIMRTIISIPTGGVADPNPQCHMSMPWIGIMPDDDDGCDGCLM